MQTFFVSLTSISDVKKFVDAATRCSAEIDVLSGRYVINAKSIMGLFSLDVAKPVKVEFHGTDAESDAFRKDIAALIAEVGE